MNNEFNRNNGLEFFTPAREFSKLEQNFTAIEHTPNTENAAPQEQAATPSARSAQGNGNGKEKKKQTELLAKVLATTLAFSTGVVGTALVSPAADVRFEELGATENGVQYSIFVEDITKPLILVLQNDFTKRQVTLEEGENFGEFTGLASNMQYVLTVRYADGLQTEIARKNVRTLQEEEIQLGVSSVEYSAAENAQGKFSFTPYYQDPNGVWTEMYALLTDEYGVGEGRATIAASGEPCEIQLTDCGFFGSNGKLQVWAVSAETGELELLYEQSVLLTKTATEIRNISFVAAGEDAIARCAVTFVDENGYWNSLESGKKLELEIVALDEGYDHVSWYDIYESGEICEIMIFRVNYGKEGNVRLNIYAYDDLGESICVATQTHKAIGGAFVPNSSDTYEEGME